MSAWQAFWLGVIVAYSPSLIFAAIAAIGLKARLAVFMHSRASKQHGESPSQESGPLDQREELSDRRNRSFFHTCASLSSATKSTRARAESAIQALEKVGYVVPRRSVAKH